MRSRIVVQVQNLATVAALIEGSYEAICALMSESWDTLSDETKQEAAEMLIRLQEMMP